MFSKVKEWFYRFNSHKNETLVVRNSLKALNIKEITPKPYECDHKGKVLDYIKTLSNVHDSANEATETEKIWIKRLYRIRSPLRGHKPVDFKANEAVMVLQHEYAITDAADKLPILGTFAAGPCVIVALYDDINEIALLAHVDAVTDLDPFSQLLNTTFSKENTVAHLSGGQVGAESLCIDVIKKLEENNIKILNIDILKSSFEVDSLAIDSRNGQIYTPVTPDQLTRINDNLGPMLYFFTSPLVCCYQNEPVEQSSDINEDFFNKDVVLQVPLFASKPSPLGFWKPLRPNEAQQNLTPDASRFY
ncbi:MAG: hypothetical protein H2069_07760 [Legionella sp.]|nr:hypothetical protein [Legionella sp.]